MATVEAIALEKRRRKLRKLTKPFPPATKRTVLKGIYNAYKKRKSRPAYLMLTEVRASYAFPELYEALMKGARLRDPDYKWNQPWPKLEGEYLYGHTASIMEIVQDLIRIHYND